MDIIIQNFQSIFQWLFLKKTWYDRILELGGNQLLLTYLVFVTTWVMVNGSPPQFLITSFAAPIDSFGANFSQTMDRSLVVGHHGSLARRYRLCSSTGMSCRKSIRTCWLSVNTYHFKYGQKFKTKFRFAKIEALPYRKEWRARQTGQGWWRKGWSRWQTGGLAFWPNPWVCRHKGTYPNSKVSQRCRE